MAKTYTITMSLSGFSCSVDSSSVRNATLTKYTSSTSSLRFGATGNYATGYAVRAAWPSNSTVTHIKGLAASAITSIKMTVNYGTHSYNIGTRYGILSASSGSAAITSASASTVTSNANTTSLTVDITSFGISSYGYAFGGTVSSASYANVTSIVLTVVTSESDYSYTLAYNANNGSGAPGNQTGSNTATSPSYTFTISSTKPTRSGYRFLGWSKSSTATSASYSAGGSITVTSSGTTTLYAVWQAYKVTIRYNVNGGSITTGTGTTRYRVSSNLVQRSTNSGSTWENLTSVISTGSSYIDLWNVGTYGATRAGYYITGTSAYRAKSTSGTLINQDTTSASSTNAATIARLTGSATLTGDVTVDLYINWTINTYTVSYNKGSHGTGTNTSDTKTHGTALTLKGAIFTRTGYTQTGWSTSDGGSKAYNLSASYTANASITLYPFWTINTYTVSYNKGSYGTGTNTSDTKTYGVTLTLKGAIFTRTGYTQTGWSTTDGGSKVYDLSGAYTANASVTLYPFWERSSSVYTKVGNTIYTGSIYIKINGVIYNGILCTKKNGQIYYNR